MRSFWNTAAVCVVLATLTIISVKRVYAHGEDLPGPNGGVIRMPGAFHTEALAIGSKSVDVYLLDFNWQHPSVIDSSVTAIHRFRGQETALRCEPEGARFRCNSSEAVLNAGTLVIRATRRGEKGVAVEYPLPLAIENQHEAPY